VYRVLEAIVAYATLICTFYYYYHYYYYYYYCRHKPASFTSSVNVYYDSISFHAANLLCDAAVNVMSESVQ